MLAEGAEQLLFKNQGPWQDSDLGIAEALRFAAGAAAVSAALRAAVALWWLLRRATAPFLVWGWRTEAPTGLVTFSACQWRPVLPEAPIPHLVREEGRCGLARREGSKSR